MPSGLKRRKHCRLCEGGNLQLVLPIAASPIGDAYVTADKLHEEQALYPLDLYLCMDCAHVQNLDVVDPEILFRDYIYVTSSSLGLVEHYRRYSDEVSSRLGVTPGSLVVEIGSNDGSLLQFFKALGMRVVGIDPARRIADEATAKGIPTLPEFFSSALARDIRTKHGPAAIVAANNVFAHADDLADIVRGVRVLLDEDGVFVFEVSYLVDIVDRFLFDTVYHEHVCYHSIVPLERFLKRLGMQLFDVQRISSKGGSIRCFSQRLPEGKRPTSPIVGELSGLELERGFGKPEVYRAYGAAIEQRKRALHELIDSGRAAGKTVAGYGASTTVTTLTWHFALMDKLEFLVDDNPRKQGLYSPGCHTPVIASEELYTRRPDYVVVLAWNYAEAIIKRHQRFIAEGGCFVVPLPELRVVSAPGAQRADGHS
jgi:SAM-dependent methyltransferase